MGFKSQVLLPACVASLVSPGLCFVLNPAVTFGGRNPLGSKPVSSIAGAIRLQCPAHSTCTHGIARLSMSGQDRNNAAEKTSRVSRIRHGISNFIRKIFKASNPEDDAAIAKLLAREVMNKRLEGAASSAKSAAEQLASEDHNSEIRSKIVKLDVGSPKKKRKPKSSKKMSAADLEAMKRKQHEAKMKALKQRRRQARFEGDVAVLQRDQDSSSKKGRTPSQAERLQAARNRARRKGSKQPKMASQSDVEAMKRMFSAPSAKDDPKK